MCGPCMSALFSSAKSDGISLVSVVALTRFVVQYIECCSDPAKSGAAGRAELLRDRILLLLDLVGRQINR